MQRADRVYYFVSDCQEVQPTGWFDCVTLHTPACAAFDASVDTKFTWFHSVKSSSSVIACFYIAYWTQLLVYPALWLVYLRMSAFGKLFFVIPLPLTFSMHILCFHKIHAQNWFLYRSKSFRISFQDGKTVSVVKFVLITKFMQIYSISQTWELFFVVRAGQLFIHKQQRAIRPLTGCNGWTENAGPENGGPKKMKYLKMQDMKIKDQMSGHENAGPEMRHRKLGDKQMFYLSTVTECKCP